MTARVGTAVMALCLLLYIVLVGWRAIALLSSGTVLAVVMGVALIVLPLVGLWALWREVLFGFAADRLSRRLSDEGALPVDDSVELGENGRIARAQAPAVVQRFAAEADAQPDDWRRRLRLGMVQDAAGQRKPARASVREAIRLEKQHRG